MKTPTTIKIVLQDESGSILEEAIIMRSLRDQAVGLSSVRDPKVFIEGLAMVVARSLDNDPVRAALQFPFFVRGLIRMLKHAISEE